MAQGGFDNLFWCMGVVEDRRDPQKLGRVRVRWFDVHPSDTSLVATEDLPWAVPVIGTYDTNYKPPLEGSWVFGFMLDGDECQHPMLLGTIPGMPTSFIKPGKAYNPKTDNHPKPVDAYQPDIPREARAEDLCNSSVLRRFAGVNTKHSKAAVPASEPKPAYNAKYPHNKVHKTESGHLIEYDDTPGSERINIEHKGGSYVEFQPNKSVVAKTYGNKYEINEEDKIRITRKNETVIIEGASNIVIEGASNLTVEGSVKQTVNGNYELGVAGDFILNVGNTIKMKGSSIYQEAYLDSISQYAKMNMESEAGQNLTMSATGGMLWAYGKTDVRIQSDANIGAYAKADWYLLSDGQVHQRSVGSSHMYSDSQIHLQSSSNFAIQSTGGDMDIKSSGDMDLDSDANVNINSGVASAATEASHHSYTPQHLDEDPTKTTQNDKYGNKPAMRTLLGDAPERKFSMETKSEIDPDRDYGNILDDLDAAGEDGI